MINVLICMYTFAKFKAIHLDLEPFSDPSFYDRWPIFSLVRAKQKTHLE